MSAGADMILSKPLKIRSLQLLLEFVSENGPVVSRPGCQLEEYNNKVQWIPIKQVKIYHHKSNSVDTSVI